MLSKSAILSLILICLCHASWCEISVNNYSDPNYPGRCVLDLDDEMILLRMGESYQINMLPCTVIFCVGNDGWGMLETCDEKKIHDEDCRESDIINWNAPFPECCKRRMICD